MNSFVPPMVPQGQPFPNRMQRPNPQGPQGPQFYDPQRAAAVTKLSSMVFDNHESLLWADCPTMLARIALYKQAQKEMEMFMRDQAQRQQILEALTRKLWPENAAELQKRLKDERPTVRWVAAQVIARRRLPLAVDLIALLTDPSDEVREAARLGLVRLSRGCDFGPLPEATTAQQTQAVNAWRRWLAQQDAPQELTPTKTQH